MTRSLCLALAVFTLAACSSSSPGISAELQAYCLHADPAEVEPRITEIIRSLTLDEKARMMAGARGIPVRGLWRAASVSGNDAFPGIAALDGPRGLSRFSNQQGTAFPVASLRGATWDPDLERRVGRAVGQELRSVGADTLLAPTINILNHPRWGRAQETYGEDPLHMGDFGVAFIEGAQELVLTTVKHYTANNIENTRLEVDVTVGERALREFYLPQFRRAVQEAHVASIMTSYNSVNGDFASQNAPLLTDILRDEWGFQGFTMSDFVWGTHDTVPAVEAGLDLEMPTPMIYGEPLAQAVRDGDVDEALLDASVRRLLRAQLCYALDTNPAVADPTMRETPEHLALAREVAERGITLLKNEGGALPIDRSAAPSIVVVGSLADVENIGDEGSSLVSTTDVVTALEGLTDAAGTATVTHVPGDLSDPTDRATVMGADVVVAVVGYTSDEEGEGNIAAGDRADMLLPADDIALLGEATQLNTRVIAVVEGGASIVMDPWLADVEAVVFAFYPGGEGGLALADILYGDVNPSGRLPMAFPVAESDLPPFDNVSLAVTYPYFFGQRHLDNEGTNALFPLGYGLSYTSYTYDAARIASTDLGPDDTLAVEVDVTNAGSVAGIETVQLYVAAPRGVMRPLRDLRGYAQIELAAGASGTVTIEVPVSELAYWDDVNDRWALEAGTYTAHVGRNAADFPHAPTFTVTP